MEIVIEQLKTLSPGVTDMLNNLLVQLDSNSKKLADEDIREIIEGQSNRLFIAREPDGNKMIGMLTLIVYRIPVWKKGWIEDLVVDRAYRNKGIATKLIHYAVKNARAAGVSSLNFTSRPERKDANKLYQRLGFEKRNTNIYRMKLQ